MKKEYLIPDIEIVRFDLGYAVLETTIHLSPERPTTTGGLGEYDDDSFDLDSLMGDGLYD